MASELDIQLLDSNKNITNRNYWQQRLENFEFSPCFEDLDARGEWEDTNTYGYYTSTASLPVYQALTKIAPSAKAQHIVLLSVLGVLASRYSSYRDLAIFCPVYTNGQFSNTDPVIVPFRMSNPEDTFFSKFLITVKDSLIRDMNHGHYPVDRLLEKYGSSLKNIPATVMIMEGLQNDTAFGPLQPEILFLFSMKEQLTLKVKYRVSKFTETYIARITKYYFDLLSCLINNKEKGISQIELVSGEEKQELIYRYNNTKLWYPQDKTLHQLFEEQVNRTPEDLSVEQGGVTLSYAQLNNRANQLAGLLREKGVGPDVIVGIYLDRSPELIISILAVLKAGGCYLPVETDLPEERVKLMMADSRCQWLISGEKWIHAPALKNLSGTGIINIDQWEEAISGYNKPEDSGTPSHLAYVLYTSGTTGLPKGVMISHRSVVNYTWWAAANYVRAEKVNFPLYTSIAFDLTVTSVFTPLLTGNKIIIYHDEEGSVAIEKVIDDNKADIIKLTPSHLKLLAAGKWRETAAGSRIKTMIVGGEKLETSLAGDIYNKFQANIRIYNEYGPTEATVGCMIHAYHPGETYSSVPVGVPAGNMEIYVLDRYLHPVPEGVKGEMYISGDGIASGYLNQAELTMQQFIPHIYIGGSKLYKTGDWARWLPGGVVEYLGRIDSQVKIRGFRVEPGEIESRLAAHEEVRACVVVVKEKENDQFVVAYYVADRTIATDSLQNHLSGKLPHYMLPSFYVRCEKMPLTTNGKLNRQALPDPFAELPGKYVAPSGETEMKLAEIWSGVLKIEATRISVSKSFFELGGNSLKLIELNIAIQSSLHVNIPVPEMFRHHTISAMAKFITDGDAGTEKAKKELDLETGEMQTLINLFESGR